MWRPPGRGLPAFVATIAGLRKQAEKRLGKIFENISLGEIFLGRPTPILGFSSFQNRFGANNLKSAAQIAVSTTSSALA
jgi:hypothetical protein